jgi:hypothetical protein
MSKKLSKLNFAKARRSFCVGPDKRVIIEKNEICPVLSINDTHLCVKPKCGGFFGWSKLTHWELIIK